ncbi:RNA deprotection pyrophosphohydrolase [Alkalicoccobacillus plakortidis]|uniref:Nucleoside triphosphatase YtkD n=1 Tax=Alkalicoccobacillus plakortidis TaxID=444060 RepID=A0ABT0XHI7_9BACI|nr:nucleoside triphosphatase YtkD [Alkalicoccobacillus plakortidis]MCM2675371.1 nucleoside triphosphatase YtkD [Alkalicoccobacillus plakortidis]
MHTFMDAYQREVQLAFKKDPFSSMPKHVWVICMYKNQWLLTNHKKRGLEFPGGKVEQGESPLDAARREVFEETGASVKTIQYIGQYTISDQQICKNIYFAEIDDVEEQNNYFETEGPVLVNELPDQIAENQDYSFIMKDGVLQYCLEYIQNVQK